MAEFVERRKERRLQCDWPVWFTEGLGKTLYRGRMLDISSEGVAFTCRIEKKFPQLEQKVTTHFNVPHVGADDDSDITTFTRESCIYRIDPIDEVSARVAVRFNEPLDFKPGKLEALHQLLAVGSKADCTDSAGQ